MTTVTISDVEAIFERTNFARENPVGPTEAETADQSRTGSPLLCLRSLCPGALLYDVAFSISVLNCKIRWVADLHWLLNEILA